MRSAKNLPSTGSFDLSSAIRSMTVSFTRGSASCCKFMSSASLICFGSQHATAALRTGLDGCLNPFMHASVSAILAASLPVSTRPASVQIACMAEVARPISSNSGLSTSATIAVNVAASLAPFSTSSRCAVRRQKKLLSLSASTSSLALALDRSRECEATLSPSLF